MPARNGWAPALAATLLLCSACARAVEVRSGPAPTYPVEIRNTLSEDIIVAYDDGSGPRTLGTVRASGSERYIIAAPRAITVLITGRSARGERSWGPYNVQLQAGATQTVTIR